MAKRQGEVAFQRIEKINSELLSFTYGAIVVQLLKDYEDVDEVNNQLDKMGYNIGLRLVDEFLAKSGVNRCTDFKETAESIAKVGFKMFLGITANVSGWNTDNDEFSLLFDDNALTDFVELPEQFHELFYSNVLCGVIRAALEMVGMRVECEFVRCMLRGDDQNEIRVRLTELLMEEVPTGDD